MGRGRVILERIENKINRQVSFSKRRNGLLKKACELSVLCEAEVGVIIFSSRGKLYEFGSPDLSITLERYRQFCYSSQDHIVDEDEAQNLFREIPKLRMQYESLQRSERHFLGENLEELGIKELENLEKRLDKTLSQTRQRTTTVLTAQSQSQKMIERLEELRKKESELEEIHQQLQSKLEEERKLSRFLFEGQVDSNVEPDGNNIRVDQSPLSTQPIINHVDQSQLIIMDKGYGPIPNPQEFPIDHEPVIYQDHHIRGD